MPSLLQQMTLWHPLPRDWEALCMNQVVEAGAEQSYGPTDLLQDLLAMLFNCSL